MHARRIDRSHATAFVQRDAGAGEFFAKRLPNTRIVRCEKHVRSHQGEGERIRVGAGPRRISTQPVAEGQEQFHPARTAAHHHDAARASRRKRTDAQHLELLEEAPDRLDRDGVALGARDARQGRRDADIDRDEIVSERRPAFEEDAPGGPVEPPGGCVDQPRAGRRAEADEVDMRLAPFVEAGDHAGHHSRIGRLQVPGDERDARPLLRTSGKGGDDVHMGVAAADKHDVSGERPGWPHASAPQPGKPFSSIQAL
jgi:hypothetical protein